MTLRPLIFIALTAAIGSAAPRQRAWEDGKVLDNQDNPYFAGKDPILSGGAKPVTFSTNEYYNVTQNPGASNTVYDHYIIEGKSAAYLVQFAHLKSYPSARVTPRRAIKFAVEKSKLWFLDERGEEYETQILKAIPRPGPAPLTQVQTPEPASPAPKAAPKQETVVAAKQEAPAAVKPPPPVVVAKAEVKEAPAVVKSPKPEPAAKPSQPQADRPWQSGQLLSTAANPFFANVAYTTESDAATWTFALGSDGKFTAFIHAAASSASSYIYDNYVIESVFCGYLVQRTRLRTIPPVRFSGTMPLKFAIEKTKIWIIDEEGKEYEAKIVKQIQKDPEGQAPVRTAVR